MPICRNQYKKKALFCSRNGFCSFSDAPEDCCGKRLGYDMGANKIKQNAMDENNLNNGINELLNMFKRMMENQDIDAIAGISEEQKEQLKEFLENFDEIKDEMKVEIYKLDPFSKQLMGMVMGQLKNITGDNPQAQNTDSQQPIANKEKQLTDIPGTNENLEAQLAKIDEQLRKPDLSDDDLNRLLDERTAIMKELETK